MKSLWRIVLLAVAYFATGKLALLLAIPPGYATAIWPPAGIALAALLVYGYRAWPGVFLGSFAVNLSASLDAGSILRSVAIASGIGIGATLQGVISTALILRFLPRPLELIRESEILKFLLLGGPLGCLVNATASVALLRWAGLVTAPEIPFSWWTWWTGDTIGVLTLTPLTLSWIGTPREVWNRRRYVIAGPVLGMIAVVVIFFLRASNWEEKRIEFEFETRSRSLAEAVQRKFGESLETLRSTEGLYANGRTVDRETFHDFVRPLLQRHPEIQAISWNPVVPESQRDSFEREVGPVLERDASGGMIPARKRSEYVAVKYIAPTSGNERALGYDVSSEATRREALIQTGRSGAPEATARIRLVQEQGNEWAILVFSPIYRPDRTLAGYATAVLRLRPIVEAALDGLDQADLHLQLRDEGSDVLYGDASPERTGQLQFRSEIHFAGRTWRVETRGDKAFAERAGSWRAWTILALGLLFVGVLGAFLLATTGRSIAMERIGARRMSELAHANEALALELAQQRAAQAELALRESEARMDLILRAVPIVLYVLKADDHFVPMWISSNIGRVSGFGPKDWIGNEGMWPARVHPEDRSRWLSEYAAVLKTGQVTTEYRWQRADGQWRHFVDQAILVRDSDGRPKEILGAWLDITERREAEEALHRSREMARLAIEKTTTEIHDLYNHAPCGYHSLDREGRFVRINDTELSWLGYARDEVIGKLRIQDILAPESLESFDARFATFMATGSVRDVEGELLRKDGSRLPVMVSSTAVRDASGGFVMTRSTVYDMTDRKRLEAQLHQAQKMDAIGRLAGGIAHDFNNLLTAITGFSMLLLERLRPGSEMYEDVQEIHRAGVRAADLTRQLLAFSRKQVLQPRTIDLNEIITSMERLLRRLISENISLSVQLQRSLGVTRADPGQIEQVLLNLCVNARDAMPSGGSLIIETRNVEVAGTRDEVPAGSYVLFSVADTGVGMTAETRAHIFEPFFTTKPVGKGTGLGLSTVYGIVKQSGGHITVESAPGKGTTFSIYLPRVEAPKEPSSDPSLSGERPRGGETVLVVEDDSGVRSLIRGLLRDQGYRVLEASDGAEALRVSERHRAPIDLLITDLVMPNLGGRELVGRLGKERSGMRILFMSGYEEQSIVGSPPLGPGMGFMGKPFTPEALCRTVRAMLNG